MIHLLPSARSDRRLVPPALRFVGGPRAGWAWSMAHIASSARCRCPWPPPMGEPGTRLHFRARTKDEGKPLSSFRVILNLNLGDLGFDFHFARQPGWSEWLKAPGGPLPSSVGVWPGWC